MEKKEAQNIPQEALNNIYVKTTAPIEKGEVVRGYDFNQGLDY